MRLSLILSLALTAISSCSGCNPFAKNNPVYEIDSGHKDDHIESQAMMYCRLARSHFKDGYYGPKCDSLLFTSLHGIMCPGVDIEPFFVDGRPFRSPQHDCFKPGDIGSSASRDMVIGALAYMWHHNRLDLLSSLIEYARSHAWNICENDYSSAEVRIGRCTITPSLKALMYEVYAALGGECDKECMSARVFSQPVVPQARGYEAHLAILSALISGSVTGSIDDIQLSALQLLAEREPRNALFQAVYHRYKDGDMTKALEILKDEDLFPGKELPTTDNYCTEYLFQRDIIKPGKTETDPDWLPCKKTPPKVHSGTEFIFTTAIITGKFRHWSD